jgi:hypothetical protein
MAAVFLQARIVRAVWVIALVAVIVTTASPAAPQVVTARSAPPDSAALATGTGLSYWGAIPPPSDSTTAAFENRKRQIWEWVLLVPYSVINIPLRGIRYGIGGLIVFAERANFWRYVNVVPVPKGFVPGIDYGSAEGLGLTAIYYNNFGSAKNPLRIRASYTSNSWQKYTAGAIWNKKGGVAFQAGGGYRLRPELRFFGIGPNSELKNEAFYTDERAWVGGLFRTRPSESSVVSFMGVYSSVTARDPGSKTDQSIEDMFPGADVPPGFKDRSEGAMLRLTAAYTSAGTADYGAPSSGTILGASAGAFLDSGDDDLNFLAYRFEFQQFIPLWHQHRTLAVRAYLNWMDNQGAAPIPFTRMFINEVPDQFRGYITSRWRDIGITGVTLEYRFPFLTDRPDGGFGIDTVLLTDIGQVFGDFDQIRRDNLTFSYGFGFRTYLNKNFLGTMEFNWSDDGFEFRLATKQLFQFTRDVLFQGREETLVH